jgi:hypothetical protein
LVSIKRGGETQNSVPKQIEAWLQSTVGQPGTLYNVTGYFHAAISQQMPSRISNTYIVFKGDKREFGGNGHT